MGVRFTGSGFAASPASKIHLSKISQVKGCGGVFSLSSSPLAPGQKVPTAQLNGSPTHPAVYTIFKPE